MARELRACARTPTAQAVPRLPVATLVSDPSRLGSLAQVLPFQCRISVRSLTLLIRPACPTAHASARPEAVTDFSQPSPGIGGAGTLRHAAPSHRMISSVGFCDSMLPV